MNEIAKVIRNAAMKAVPNDKEAKDMAKIANELLRQTRKAAAHHPETRGVVLGGSFAKGTWVPKHVDLDVFVKFDPATPEDQFERLGLAIGEAATKGHPRGKKFAQHPYTEATVNGIRVNIVPCFAVAKRQWKSAADRSPFHVRLVKGIPEAQKTQVRLLKMFMKAVGVYGAEIETQGFSGYVAEVLVIKHTDLRWVLEFFATLRFKDAPRIFSLPDPVDERRDLALAVSPEKLGRMILASRGFLRNPRAAYFEEMRGKIRSSVRNRVVAVVFTHPRLSEDTLWGELRKTTRHIVRHLEVRGFKVARSIAASDDRRSSSLLFIPEFESLSNVEQRIGPTIDREKDVRAFVASNSRTAQLVWVDDDARVRVLRPREHLRFSELLKDIIKGRAGPVGAATGLVSGLKRTGKVLSGRALKTAARKSKWLDDGIREIVSDAIGTGRT